MTESLRDKLICCGWVTNFNADTLVQLIERHYAPLAQPEPQGPTDKELWDLYQGLGRDFSPTEYARAVLARWGRPAIEPVPVAERLPGQEDCDAEGRCWWWHPDHKEDEFTDGWMSLDPKWADGHHDADDSPVYTHWLPHHALPVPQREGSDD